MTTPSQTVGPYFTIGLPPRASNELVPTGPTLHGRLLDGQGEPIPDGLIEMWDASGHHWGRCGTDADGAFAFRVPVDAGSLEVLVFARGLLRHQWTRVYLSDAAEDDVLAAVDPARRGTLIARAARDGLHFDIRLQGDDATVFFEH